MTYSKPFHLEEYADLRERVRNALPHGILQKKCPLDSFADVHNRGYFVVFELFGGVAPFSFGLSQVAESEADLPLATFYFDKDANSGWSGSRTTRPSSSATWTTLERKT